MSHALRTLAVLVALGCLTLASSTSAGPGDPRTLRGTLAWSPGGGGRPFVVVRTDDGNYYIADLLVAQSRGPLNVGERVSVVGVEGTRPFEIVAGVIGPGDTALAPSPPGSPSLPAALQAAPSATAPAAPSASPPTITPPAPASADPSRAWRRVEGKVQSIGNGVLTIREGTGATVSVDVSALRGDTTNVLRSGDEVTVFATTAAEGSDRLVAVGFVHAEPAPGSALPRSR